MRPELTDYVRTLVRGDHGSNDLIEAHLDAVGWEGFPRFLASLFFLAVDRRFGDNASTADVIRFVAALRADLSEGGPDLDVSAAETLIKSILDPSIEYTISQEMIGKIQAATVYRVLADEKLSDNDLDAFLAEAARLAERV
jgi:hypothetical protein